LRSPSVSGYKMLLKIQMTAEFKVWPSLPPA